MSRPETDFQTHIVQQTFLDSSTVQTLVCVAGRAIHSIFGMVATDLRGGRKSIMMVTAHYESSLDGAFGDAVAF